MATYFALPSEDPEEDEPRELRTLCVAATWFIE